MGLDVAGTVLYGVLPAGRACVHPASLQTRAWCCDARGAQHMQAVPLPATTALMSTPGLMTLGGSALMARFFRPCMRRACVGVRASPAAACCPAGRKGSTAPGRVAG